MISPVNSRRVTVIGYKGVTRAFPIMKLQWILSTVDSLPFTILCRKLKRLPKHLKNDETILRRHHRSLWVRYNLVYSHLQEGVKILATFPMFFSVEVKYHRLNLYDAHSKVVAAAASQAKRTVIQIPMDQTPI